MFQGMALGKPRKVPGLLIYNMGTMNTHLLGVVRIKWDDGTMFVLSTVSDRQELNIYYTVIVITANTYKVFVIYKVTPTVHSVLRTLIHLTPLHF